MPLVADEKENKPCKSNLANNICNEFKNKGGV